jgi:phosphatidylserine/phosphatidylglycerophosphate/cardiolipin synthase-like enzyme
VVLMRFLKTEDCNATIRNIIEKANKKIILICPYFNVKERIIKELIHAGENDVEIIVVMRDKWDGKMENGGCNKKLTSLKGFLILRLN